MVRYADYNDDYFGGTGQFGPHPSDNISSVLAATEAAGADSRTLILGIAIGASIFAAKRTNQTDGQIT